MKKINIAYWVLTILMAILMTISSIPDILKVPDAVTLVTNHLGYPSYFLQFIGVAKALGVIAILVPGFPRLKEWAYAGFTFDLIAAVYSSICVGDPLSQWLPIIIMGMIIVGGSYFFYHKRLKAKSQQAAA